MFNSYSEMKYGTDCFNQKRKRNIKNTNKLCYNCAGYAFETFSWYIPLTSDINNSRHYKSMIQTMLEDFPDLRVIEKISDLQSDEYAIAFRTSDCDLHFAKRAKNGVWFHKMGASERIGIMSKKEVFSKSWEYGYNSKITLFAKKIHKRK